MDPHLQLAGMTAEGWSGCRCVSGIYLGFLSDGLTDRHGSGKGFAVNIRYRESNLLFVKMDTRLKPVLIRYGSPLSLFGGIFF